MITVVCSSQHPLDNFKEEIIKSSGLPNKIEFLAYENKGEFSLTEIYNRGLKDAKYDHIVFLHNDLTIETKQWGVKLLKLFERNPEYGIIGVAGSKNMPVTGQWWANPSKMYGRVQHTHQGKSWLSSYSDDLGQNIEEVVNVDGVFFAVDRTKIKTNFNEDFKGFHFYDVSFSFENHLAGVKVGVTTAIRINHQSIGMTNDSWERNREQFAEMHKDVLPRNVKRLLRKNEKLNILLGCLSFSNLTGSELYVYELAKGLINEGHNVSICSSIGNPLSDFSKKLGIKLYSIQEPPGFKLGDGKWVLKSQNSEVVSQPNTLYKLSNIEFDIIHLNHKPIAEHLMRLYPNTPMICSIHSEILTLEEPVISPEIKKYIAIRPEIKEHLIDKFNIESEKIEVIYNPIDSNKFKPAKGGNIRSKKRVLFVGTIDYLRKNTIIDLIETTKLRNQELWIVGKKNDNYLDSLIKDTDHVTYFEPTFNIEKYIQECDETAGIMLGRTTIEGWLCGKKGWIYNVDDSGEIIFKGLHTVPKDIDKFKSNVVSKQIINEYIKILE